jgi:hypothetical protein
MDSHKFAPPFIFANFMIKASAMGKQGYSPLVFERKTAKDQTRLGICSLISLNFTM